MPPYSPDYTSSSSSVFPEAILPSIAVISLLVLITFVGAVIIFVRAYKQRKRQRLSQQEKNRQGRMEAGSSIARVTDGGDSVNAPKTGRRLLGGLFSRNRESVVSKHSSTVAITTGESKILSHNVREITEDGSYRERGYISGRAGGPVRISYDARRVRETISKIERITGNALSNDLYTDRASGTMSTRGDKTLTHGRGVPEWPRLTRTAIPSTPPHRSFESDPDSSPISPAAGETLVVQDLSPNSKNVLGLSPPPPVVTALIDRKYPNVAALARASIPLAKPSNLLPHRHSYGNLKEHIATQYSTPSRSRRAPDSSSNIIAPLLDPPPVVSGGFAGTLKTSKGKGKQVSRDRNESPTPMDPLTPFHRGSWSGRSVLELDAPESNTRKATPLPLSLQPTHPNPQPTIPKFATTPRLRIPTFSSPLDSQLPPIPPISAPTSDIANGNRPDLALSRSYSTSKMSITSIPSTVSSFNAVTAPVNPIHGLSPTPPRSVPPLETVLGKGWEKGIGTLSTDKAEMSDFTERELEVEMARVRDRARKAGEERRGGRREAERRRGGESSRL